MANNNIPNGADAAASDEEGSKKATRMLLGTQSMRLHAEELAVSVEKVETGRVRAQVVTQDRQELVDVPLVSETAVIERVPINRCVDAIPPVRTEGDTTILSVVEEVLVLERRLVLKEEIHIRVVRTSQQHKEQVTLKQQVAVITRTSPDDVKED